MDNDNNGPKPAQTGFGAFMLMILLGAMLLVYMNENSGDRYSGTYLQQRDWR